jgi:predicted O-linked N-acetylglucosamine transferase (SPINDLY family)
MDQQAEHVAKMKAENPIAQAKLNKGLALHQKGNLLRAEQLYKEALSAQPDHFRALDLLGEIAWQLKRPECAIEFIQRALRIDPNHATSYSNLGNALKDLRRFEDAIASYNTAISLKPDFAEAYNNRGVALHELKRHDEALASYDMAISLNPNYAEAHNNRGKALVELTKYAKTLISDRKANFFKPNYKAYNNLTAVSKWRSYGKALASFDTAIGLKPNYADAHYNRGVALSKLNRHEEALQSYDLAIKIQPDHAAAYYNRGYILLELNLTDKAIASFQSALEIKPDFAAAKFATCLAELPILYTTEGEIIRRRANYDEKLRAFCDDMEALRLKGDVFKAIKDIRPFYLAYQGYNDRDLQGLYGSMVCCAMERKYADASLPPPPVPGERIRVGIVSSFFRLHSNWKIPIKGWLSQLDRNRFKIFGYHLGTKREAETDVAAAMCDRFVDGGLTVEGWRREILSDAPHILIYPGLLMDSISVQLAAQRLAPVQCNSWGHPETSGMPTLDYYLSSDLMEPQFAAEHYTEQLIRLPNLSIYYEPIETESVSMSRAELGLHSDAAVFWSGQSLFKYLPQFDYVFANIAKLASNCQFVFVRHDGLSRITELFQQRLDRAFAAVGLKASDHCVFLEPLSPDKFVAVIGQCDVFLDSIGWSGCNSLLESLAHDLPIVTTPGPLMRGRHGAAILQMMGITDTIADTVKKYISIAARLANQPDERQTLSHTIADRKHRLYRDRACISALEEFLDRAARQQEV